MYYNLFFSEYFTFYLKENYQRQEEIHMKKKKRKKFVRIHQHDIIISQRLTYTKMKTML